MSIAPFVVAAWLFVVGLYGIVTSRNLIHMVACVSVTQSSTYVLLLAVGFRHHATAPVFKDIAPGTKVVDPVVAALTLTDVVVSAVVTALLLAFVIQTYKRAGTIDPDELRELQG